MGLSIQHLPGATGLRSHLQIKNLLKHAAHELPTRDYQTLKPMLDVTQTSDYPPYRFPVAQAAAMRDVLLRLAERLDRHRNNHAAAWAQEARDYATAADTAVYNRQPWTWD